MQDWVNVDVLDGLDYPEHFFRVEIDGVSRHAAGAILNREAVRGYIGEVCPVPLSLDFPFFSKVQGIFPAKQSPHSLRITLDGERQPIQRQYGSSIALSGNREDYFSEFERVRVPPIDGSREAAVGWIAHSSYLGAIPKANRIRGIRARIGNLQVGDERVFDHLFEEERFNRWCVGEVHILDQRIIPNGRRDYFERNPHLRNLENHLSSVLGHLAGRCRAASSNRNKEKRLVSTIADIEAMYELAASGCLATNDAKALVEQAMEQITRAFQDVGTAGSAIELSGRLSAVKTRIRDFHCKGGTFPLEGISPSEVGIYQRIFGAVVRRAASPRSAREIIDAVLKGSDG